MTVREAARILGCSTSTVYRWLRRGLLGRFEREGLKVGKVGRRWKIEREEKPMDWNPQVNRRHAERDGRKPEDFRWEQWPLSNVRIEPSENWRIPFWYACDYAEGTPLDNQYDDAGNRLPEPVGMCLQSVDFRLVDPDTGAKLDEQDTLPAEGSVRGVPNDGSELWNRLTPGTSLKVKLVAWPMFYFLNEAGGMVGYGVHRGHFKGAEVESPVCTLSMDHDGNVTVEAA